MKHSIILTASLSVVLAIAGCSTSELEERLNNLEAKILALEEHIGTINSNATALRGIFKEGIRIVEFKENAYCYTISLSDATEVKVIFGKTAPALLPILSVDENGKWVYSYDNGETFLPVEGADYVDAADGYTPQVKIGSDGYWLISIDGGQTWSQLLGPDGKPQSATDGAQVSGEYSTFKEVSYDAETKEMVFELSNQTVRIPVVDNFSLTVKGYVEGDSILLSEKRIYEVEMTGVADVMFQVPEGWAAELTDTELTVITPNSAVAGEYALGIVLVSTDGLLKQMKLIFNLKAVLWTNTTCKVFNDFTAGNSENVLLDFSYAGYNHGESAPLEASSYGYKVYDVTDYGAVPNDGKSDREAFLACLKAALGVDYIVNANNIITFNHKEKANAIVYFPEGEFILHTSDDDVESATASNSQTIQIRSGNFILRGAGRDKTTIVMKDPNLPADPSVLYSSPAMIEIKHNSGLDRLTDVSANAAKGAYSVQVASTSGLSEGQWVCLSVVNNNPAFVAAELAAGNPTESEMSSMTNIRDVGVQVYDYHQIKSISGNTVTFVEPIMHEVDLQYTSFTGKNNYNWGIYKYPHYENVGVEDLKFKGYAKDDFIHHGSWQDDGAYKPINMTRLANSWMRRVDFESVSEASSLTNCVNCSVYDIDFSGNRGHSAIRAQVSSRIFIGATVDKASGHLIDNPGTYMEGAGQYHAVGVSKQSMGTVLWRNVWGDDSCFESHATQPRATLIDCCKGGWMRWRQGGDQIQVPNHLADLTVWNFESTTDQSGVFDWWDHSSYWWKFLPPIIVGFHGKPTSFDALQTKLDYSNGTPVDPESLYEAQLRLRLGAVPSWLNTLKQ